MSDQSNQKNYDSILDEAALWVSRSQGRRLSGNQERAFTNWLNTSDRHKSAYNEMLETWQQAGKIADIPVYRIEADYLSKRRPMTHVRADKALLIAVAASFMLFFGIAIIQLTNQSAEVPQLVKHESFSTKAGQMLEVSLPDGSELLLNTLTSVDISFDESRRSLRLLKGQAYFEVAHDPGRPFIVNVGNSSVKAVGTAFNIYRKPKKTIVTITEGVVDIKSSAQQQGLKVDAMHKVSIDDKSVLSVLNANIDSELAWQDQQLVFRDVPLSTVITELNRYLEKPVSIKASSLPQISVSGTFDVHEPESLLKALVDNFNLTEIDRGGRRYLSAL